MNAVNLHRRSSQNTAGGLQVVKRQFELQKGPSMTFWNGHILKAITTFNEVMFITSPLSTLAVTKAKLKTSGVLLINIFLGPSTEYTNSMIHLSSKSNCFRCDNSRNQELKQLNFPLIFRTWLTSELIENTFSSSCYLINERKTKKKGKGTITVEWVTHHLIFPAHWWEMCRCDKETSSMQISHTENWIQ